MVPRRELYAVCKSMHLLQLDATLASLVLRLNYLLVLHKDFLALHVSAVPPM